MSHRIVRGRRTYRVYSPRIVTVLPRARGTTSHEHEGGPSTVFVLEGAEFRSEDI